MTVNDMGRNGKTIAIMQPYFIPYAGYFRLLALADLFVIYDCVQFQRRGWMHRNQLRTRTGERDWLTLPLQKAPQDVLIRDLKFRDSAGEDMTRQMARFPALMTPLPHAAAFTNALMTPSGDPVDHIVEVLRMAAELLNIPWQVMRSSELCLPAELKGEDRILAIARHCGATRYINAPGGSDLYQPAAFAEAGMELRFLSEYEGSYDSIAQRLASESPQDIAREIQENALLMPGV